MIMMFIDKFIIIFLCKSKFFQDKWRIFLKKDAKNQFLWIMMMWILMFLIKNIAAHQLSEIYKQQQQQTHTKYTHTDTHGTRSKIIIWMNWMNWLWKKIYNRQTNKQQQKKLIVWMILIARESKLLISISNSSSMMYDVWNRYSHDVIFPFFFLDKTCCCCCFQNVVINSTLILGDYLIIIFFDEFSLV